MDITHKGTNYLFKITLQQHTLTLELSLDQARYRMSYAHEELPSKLRSIGNLDDIYEIFLANENFEVDCEHATIVVVVLSSIIQSKATKEEIMLPL